MAILAIRSNNWNVHISLEKLNTFEIGTVFEDIAGENYNWGNFHKGDDLWFDGDVNLTCTFIDKGSRIIKFDNLTTLEQFCIALENGKEYDFLYEKGLYPQLSRKDMETIIVCLLDIIGTKESVGTQILEETISEIRNRT